MRTIWLGLFPIGVLLVPYRTFVAIFARRAGNSKQFAPVALYRAIISQMGGPLAVYCEDYIVRIERDPMNQLWRYAITSVTQRAPYFGVMPISRKMAVADPMLVFLRRARKGVISHAMAISVEAEFSAIRYRSCRINASFLQYMRSWGELDAPQSRPPAAWDLKRAYGFGKAGEVCSSVSRRLRTSCIGDIGVLASVCKLLLHYAHQLVLDGGISARNCPIIEKVIVVSRFLSHPLF